MSMKLQIDTENKIIKLESKENLNSFFKILKQLLPDNKWKEFNLETSTIINNWSSPIYIEHPPQRPYWNNPIWTISDTGNKETYQLNKGTYNLVI